MRVTRLVQRKALGKILQQGCIRCLRVAEHPLVQLKDNIDRGDGLWLSTGNVWFWRHANIVGWYSEHPPFLELNRFG
jgi:hypothetical protein